VISLNRDRKLGAELGQLLARLQTPAEKAHSDQDNAVNPIEFVYMISTKLNRATHGHAKKFNGESSEDCNEYLQALLKQLNEKPPTNNGSTSENTVRKLFEVETIEVVSHQPAKPPSKILIQIRRSAIPAGTLSKSNPMESPTHWRCPRQMPPKKRPRQRRSKNS